MPLPEFYSMDLFKDVTEDIEELHLMVAAEYNEVGPEWDMYRAE